MKQGSLRSSAYAVLTAFIWGTAFVAQSVGAEHVPPLAFNAARSVIAFVFLLVLCAVMRSGRRRKGQAASVTRSRKDLLLGGFWGGMAGAVGMTIADLTTSYVTSAPKTFLLKLCIGLITGFFAHKVFHIREEGERKVSLPVAVFLSSAAGMLFNVIADPVVGYFYKTYVLGVPQKAAAIWMKIGAVTTAVNAVVAVAVAGALYLALRPALKHARLMP